MSKSNLVHVNQPFEDDEDEISFTYNFISTPWDERTNGSKCSMTVLLAAIFIAIMGAVVNGFVIHYKNFEGSSGLSASKNCQLVKMDEYPYVAMVYSVEGKKTCVGAVIGESFVLLSGACDHNETLVIYVGVNKGGRCKSGFLVDRVIKVEHRAISNLVLLVTKEPIIDCAEIVQIANTPIDTTNKAYNIGFMSSITSLTRQVVSIVKQKQCRIDEVDLFCGTVSTICLISPGDLLVQDGKLYGVAVMFKNKTMGYFASTTPVRSSLDEIH